MSRSRVILLLLIILSIAVAYAWIATPKQRRVTLGQDTSGQVKSQHQEVSAAVFPAVADLDFSAGGDHSYQIPQKNLFGPLYLPPKVVKKTRPASRSGAKVIKPIVKPQTVVPGVVQPQGPKPIQPLNVLGYLAKAGGNTVFLSSKQGEIYLVKEGDIFAADLVVRNVSGREITISRRQTDQQVVLQLGEVKSQRLPKVRFQSDRPEFEIPQEPQPDKPKMDGAPEEVKQKVDK